MLRSSAALLPLCLLPLSAAADSGPSFDCAEATAAAEKAVCADPGLAKMDREMADIYRRARTGPDMTGRQAGRLREEQRQWIAGRDACANGGDTDRMARCLRNTYALRIANIRSEHPATFSDAPGPGARGPFTFNCDGLAPDVDATFLTGENPLAVLSWGYHRAVLPQVVVASGARYAEDGVEFWSKGAEAMFAFPNGASFRCLEAGG